MIEVTIEVTMLRVAFRSFASTLAVVSGVPRFYQFAMNRVYRKNALAVFEQAPNNATA
jgi:hypothetical protein